MRELYQVLGLARGADAKALKRAYHLVAHRTHPDKVAAAADAANLDPDARAKALQEATTAFREAVLAYEVLRDPQLRTAYDRLGMVGVHLARGQLPKRAADLGPLAERWARRLDRLTHAARRQWRAHAQAQDQRREDARRQAAGRARGADVEVVTYATLATLLGGGPCAVAAHDYHGCRACRATGYVSGRRPADCSSCAGSGALRLEVGGMLLHPRCPHCRGVGRLAGPDCAVCTGLGQVPTARSWQLRLAPRHPIDQVLRRAGGGAPGAHGGPRGDLLVRVRLGGDATYGAVGEADVGVRHRLATGEAGEGARVTVTLPDGPVALTVPRGGAHDIARTVAVAGAGLWRTDGSRGALHVTLLPPLRG